MQFNIMTKQLEKDDKMAMLSYPTLYTGYSQANEPSMLLWEHKRNDDETSTKIINVYYNWLAVMATNKMLQL